MAINPAKTSQLTTESENFLVATDYIISENKKFDLQPKSMRDLSILIGGHKDLISDIKRKDSAQVSTTVLGKLQEIFLIPVAWFFKEPDSESIPYDAQKYKESLSTGGNTNSNVVGDTLTSSTFGSGNVIQVNSFINHGKSLIDSAPPALKQELEDTFEKISIGIKKNEDYHHEQIKWYQERLEASEARIEEALAKYATSNEKAMSLFEQLIELKNK